MNPVLIVPGFHGSGEGHWQTWLQRELPGSYRLSGVDWEKPELHRWADEILRELDCSAQPLTLVAHSFGCLATALAIAIRPHKVAGAILVAPADPDRFSALGHRVKSDGERNGSPASIAQYLPEHALGCFGLLVGSRSDPWMRFEHAHAWARRWDLAFYDAGDAGHINVESGHGPWPLIKDLVQSLAEHSPANPAPAAWRDAPRGARGARHSTLDTTLCVT